MTPLEPLGARPYIKLKIVSHLAVWFAQKQSGEQFRKIFIVLVSANHGLFFGLKIALKIGRPLGLKLGKEQAHDNKAVNWVEIYSQV